MSQKKLILIDGSGFIFRSYYVMGKLTRPSDGVPVGAVYGMANMFLKLFESFVGHMVLVLFDTGGTTFRHKLYPLYKANRLAAPDDLLPQFSLCKELCHAFGLGILEKEGVEADDLIATYAKNHPHDVLIISSDKDLMQLLTPRVRMYDPLKQKMIEQEDVIKKFGVPSPSVVHVQALCGDTSDHIPGVKGIGVKSAAQLIQQFETLDNLLLHKKDIKQNKLRNLLENYEEDARLSYELVRLDDTCDNLDPCSAIQNLQPFKPTFPQAISFLKAQGFTSLVSKLSSRSHPIFAHFRDDLSDEKPTHNDDKFVESPLDCDGFLQQICRKKEVFFLFEGDHLMSGLWIDKQFFVKSIIQEAWPQLASIFADSSIKKITHDIKKLIKKLIQHKILNESFLDYADLVEYDDVAILSYSLHAGTHSHDLEELCQRYFSVAVTSKVVHDHYQNLFYMSKLYYQFYPLVKDEELWDIYEMDKKTAFLTLMMERHGIFLDTQKLQSLGKDFEDQLSILEGNVYDKAGEVFLLSSPKQLGLILFEKLKLAKGKKTKTGSYKTDSSTLEELKRDTSHPIIDDILAWRELFKLKTTYVDGLLNEVKEDGRIHTSFSLTTTSTGRLSSLQPNLQNIPIKTANGRKIRSCFCASKNRQFISYDYSQIELRLLAHMGEVNELKEAFCANEDVHTLCASRLFHVAPSLVTAQQRRVGKTINFGIIYGISAFGLSQQLGISTSEAQSMIHAYFNYYPEISGYIEKTTRFAKKHGYAQTLFKRRCHVPSIHSKNTHLQQFAIRQAVNAPLQGSSADIMKLAMIAIADLIKGSEIHIILQIHDEVILEMPESVDTELLGKIHKAMENVVELDVPLIVNYEISTTLEK